MTEDLLDKAAELYNRAKHIVLYFAADTDGLLDQIQPIEEISNKLEELNRTLCYEDAPEIWDPLLEEMIQACEKFLDDAGALAGDYVKYGGIQ